MSVRVTINDSRASAGINSIMHSIPAAEPEALTDVANLILEDARRQVPVRTGRLKRSLGIIRTGVNMLEGGTDSVPYAGIVHNGLGRGRNSMPRTFIATPFYVHIHSFSRLFWDRFTSHHTLTS